MISDPQQVLGSDESIIQVREMVAHNPRLDQDLIAVIQKFRDDEQVKCLLDISRVLLTACYLPRVTYRVLLTAPDLRRRTWTRGWRTGRRARLSTAC